VGNKTKSNNRDLSLEVELLGNLMWNLCLKNLASRIFV